MADLVLVTDAAGFTGSHVVEHLLKAGYRVRGVAEPQAIVSLRAAYLVYGDRFEAVGVADLDHDDLTNVFRDINAIILSTLPLVKGHAMNTANLIMESGSSGTRHVLEHARAANVKRVIHTGSFANVLHPDDSWNPIVVTEDDWNSQTQEDCKTLGLHPWCLQTAARVIAERELWKFSDANPDIDVTSILPGFQFGPYGRGQATDLQRTGTFAWISALLHGPPGRPMTPNAPPFSPNYVHVADVARAHVAALRTGPLDPPRRKRVLLVAGYMLWHEVIAHLTEAMPEIKERLPSAMCGPGPQAMAYARLETKNAREILGIEDYKSWRDAIEDAVRDLLRVDSNMLRPQA
ncbi:hypothetical protein DFH94DRAFT_89549 [Russula ochroleuca]|jgi:nucleoside-diphosphate-sugar epimerase|uniref:NAD-dependent epimerase/dehydratase domain-containing protein n=1 Tax=Russula ochroleuca TaxID=152965 RepID=A0A9P5MSI7_9AGAM|nr:hypothetical protein DFH94DRAFT_89549 [Russula ochroleuca]